MYYVINFEYIGLKHYFCGVIFEADILLLDEQYREVYSYEWNLK